MSDLTFDVAIIGAGFTGTALAVHLLRVMPRGSRILMLGSPKATARGLAYGTDNPDHLLNVRAGRMSLLADDMLHFTRWLVESGHGRGRAPSEIAEAYVPRRLYGRYLRETLRSAVAKAIDGVRLALVEDPVTDLQRSGPGFTLRTATEERHVARSVALCLGNQQAALPLPAAAITGMAGDHVIADPWSDYRVQLIAADARVLLIGAGLTMVDQVLTLLGRGHAGPLVAASRHGLLPRAHRPGRSEPRAIDLPPGKLSLRSLFKAVVDAARAEDAAGRDWRTIVDGLRPVTQQLWQRLDVADRSRFFRHVASLWSIHRHRMAPSIAARIADLRASGRLSLWPAQVRAIRKSGRGVTVALQGRRNRTVTLQPFDWVINCAGVRAATADPLVARLVNQGLARPDALGRGLDVVESAHVVGRSGAPTSGLFALGPLTAGTLLEITAVPDIREQCAVVAGEIARQVAEANAVAEIHSGRAGESSAHRRRR